MNIDKVHLLGASLDKKPLYLLGRSILSLTLMAFGVFLLTGYIDRTEDLKAYHSFWLYLDPSMSYGGRDYKEELMLFAKESLFEYQR